MATSLTSDDCSSVAEANALFATQKGLLVLRPSRGCCSMYFTIPSGCYALVTRHGADLNYVDGGNETAVWPAGLHYPYPPWTGVANLVTKQSIVLDMPVKACKTKDNVTVNVDVGLVFRIMGDRELGEDPELVRKFVYQVKPRGLEQQLRDAQEEAVRALARSMKHTEIYGIRSGKENGDKPKLPAENEDGDSDSDEVFVGSSDQKDREAAKFAISKGESVAAAMRERLNKQFIPQGVQILSVMIKEIKLPENIIHQMTEKTMVISANAQQRMYHEDAMQNTRMEEEVNTMLQSFKEQRAQEISSGAETLNAEKVRLNDAIAQANKAEANIRQEAKVSIENMQAENALEVQRVTDRMYEAVATIKAESEKEAAELVATSTVDSQSVLADASLQATKNEAEADRVIAKAEGKIAPWLALKKEYETKAREMNVYDRLADNQGLVVAGGSDEDANLLTVADAILQDFEYDDPIRSKLLAELAVMSKGAASFLPNKNLASA